MRSRFIVLLALVLIAGAALAVWRGSGPLPDPEGCRVTVGERTVMLQPEQAENATLIAAIGMKRGLLARGVSIALATAYQESKIRNLDHGDRDSLGIFQQRPSQGWGTAAQVTDPFYSINKFYEALAKIDGYESMRITVAAQKVQRSGYPEAYEPHAADARALASALTGYSPGGRFTCVVDEVTDPGNAASVRTLLTRAYGDLDIARTGQRQDLVVTVGSGDAGHRKGWSIAQFLLAHAAKQHIHSVSFDGLSWTPGGDSQKGWQKAPTAKANKIRISLG